MSKKNKDKNQLAKAIKKTGYNNGQTSVGFVLEHLGFAQSPFLCISNSNKWLSRNFGTDIAVFFEQNSIPCLPMIFPRYNIMDSFAFEGNLISTCMKTALLSKNATRARRYYYINDLEKTRSWFHYSDEDVDSIMKNDEIIKFCRSEDHRKYLVEQGYNIHKTIVTDFDISQVLEIINDNRN